MLLDLDSPSFTKEVSEVSEKLAFLSSSIEGDIETQVFSAMILWEKTKDDPSKLLAIQYLISPAKERGQRELDYSNTPYNPVVCGCCRNYISHRAGPGDILFCCATCSVRGTINTLPFFLGIAPHFISHHRFLAGQHRTLAARLIYNLYSKNYPEGF